MADDPTPMGEKISAASLLVRLLAILEKVLPAFLVAWNNSLQQKNKQLRLQNAKLETTIKVEAKRHELESYEEKPAEVIDRFLDRHG